ncbi:hypothetical protein TTHERM_00161280 (macronuclear) [Tetrahymena thermophila SB210]|uniref:Uncharacterized protein n=1 Tax=Tetrahymena thermophila (strain SB210) TaxID=312017 RepID=Q22W04_TETTS|nr:hypothetical protein TTHERM_00161280 [Tetrahymena thermophila SB210]EAR89612.2 hypothetical protein TTHERM_00161280 [Tetrahymena thermophila SB210]|eukprot:XP_001009858.2 hypothetical protein TTHERM_00161280 [Tetrahymena thermophila SB210]
MEQQSQYNRRLNFCEIQVVCQQHEIIVKFKDIAEEQYISLLENCLKQQEISFYKSECQIESDQQLSKKYNLTVSKKIYYDFVPMKFSNENTQNSLHLQKYLQQLQKYLSLACLSQYILCKELFFNDFAIILPSMFFGESKLNQVREFFRIFFDEGSFEQNKESIQQQFIINEYQFCIDIIKQQHFTKTLNWKNIKKFIQQVDDNQEFFIDRTQNLIVDYIKSPNIISKVLNNLPQEITFLRLNTCSISKLESFFPNKYIQQVENLELISLNQDQYLFANSRLKVHQINQFQEHFCCLKRLVLVDLVADVIKANKLEQLTVINNYSDVFYIELDSNCALQSLIVQRVNAFQINEVQFLQNLQKLILFDVDILEKDLQMILDISFNLRYLKMKDIHFINWQLQIKNQNLEYISLDTMEFEQEISDIFCCEAYPTVKYFAYINCRMHTDITLNCFNKFKNAQELCLIDNTLGDHFKLDISEMTELRKLTLLCKQCKLYISDESKLQILDFKNTNVINFEKIASLLSSSAQQINISQQVFAASFVNEVKKLSFSNLVQINLSNSKLSGALDFSQLCCSASNLKQIDLSNNQITEFSLLSENSNLNTLNLSYNALQNVLLNINSVNNLLLNNNSLNKIEQISIQRASFICLHKNKLDNVQNLLEQANQVEELDISCNNIEDLTILSICKLKKLDASCNKIKQVHLIGEIDNLDLTNNQLQQLILSEEEQNIIKIKHLTAKKNKLEEIPKISNKSLLRLDISYNQIKTIKQQQLTYDLLENLNLSNNLMQSCDDLFQSKSFPKLEILNLSSNLIESIDENVDNLQSLKDLNLSKNSIDSADPLFVQPNNLEKIDLSFNNLISLTRYQINSQNKIKILKLKKNTLTDSSLNKFANLNNLEILDISMNLFTDCIKFYHQLPKLNSLTLALNNLTNEGIKNIFECIQDIFPSLEQIDIMHTQGNTLPQLKSTKISYIYQDNNFFFDNLEQNKQLYIKGILFQS